jgi:hypothetical protein
MTVVSRRLLAAVLVGVLLPILGAGTAAGQAPDRGPHVGPGPTVPITPRTVRIAYGTVDTTKWRVIAQGNPTTRLCVQLEVSTVSGPPAVCTPETDVLAARASVLEFDSVVRTDLDTSRVVVGEAPPWVSRVRVVTRDPQPRVVITRGWGLGYGLVFFGARLHGASRIRSLVALDDHDHVIGKLTLARPAAGVRRGEQNGQLPVHDVWAK